MDLIIKKYFWVVPVIVVVVCSALSAQAVNYYLEGKLLAPSDTAPPIPRDLKPDTKANKAKKSKDGEPMVKRNMFCAECLPPEPDPAVAATDPGGGVPATSLPLQLVATMVSDEEKNSFVTIRHTDTGGQAGYSFGDEIKDAGEIVSIRGKHVDFRNTKSRRVERVAFGGGAAPKPAASKTKKPIDTGRPKSARAEMMSLIDEGVKKVGENRYEIDRAVVDKVKKNPTLVAKGARVVPSIKNGKTQGFKLYAVRPSSVYAKLGLMNGDTLHSINNFELNSIDKGLEIYTKLGDANNITLNVTRRGKPVTLNYSIK